MVYPLRTAPRRPVRKLASIASMPHSKDALQIVFWADRGPTCRANPWRRCGHDGLRTACHKYGSQARRRREHDLPWEPVLMAAAQFGLWAGNPRPRRLKYLNIEGWLVDHSFAICKSLT